jgi:hypothetical protein
MLNWRRFCVFCSLMIVTLALVGIAPANAGLNDDRYDGNIFALYGGNGSLVPPRISLSQAINDLKRPALIAFYVDDSADSKHYTPLLNQVQAFYGKVVTIIPVAVDSLDLDHPTQDPSQEAFYYRGFIPQTVVVNTDGKVIFDQEGKPSFESLELVLRETLNLPFQAVNPEARDSTIKQINEINP